jgi:hypothetical protein
LTLIEKENEPNSFEEALSQPVWCNAMRYELMALEKNETWVVVPLPNEKKTHRVQMGIQNKIP